MAATIPESHRDLFEKRAFAHLATLMPDGSPQVTPVWVDFDGRYILINSAVGRRKDRNMRKRPQVALSILDPDNPYRMLAVRGRVTEITEECAREHIDKLARKYIGVDKYNRPTHEQRVIYKIEPQHVATMG